MSDKNQELSHVIVSECLKAHPTCSKQEIRGKKTLLLLIVQVFEKH
jgi:hypothetical protein